MAKVLAVAGLAVLAIVAAPVAAGIAAGGLAGGLAAAGTAMAGFGTALIGGAGIAAGIQAWGTVGLIASMALRPKSVGRGNAGSQVDMQADPYAGMPLILGRSATAGKVLHSNTSGQADKNARLWFLLALTAGPMGGVEAASANEFPLMIGGDAGVTSPAQFAGAMSISYTPGNKPDATAYYPPGVQPAWRPEWGPNHKLSGMACAWLTLLFDAKKYPTGVPKPLFVVLGPTVYDPRADSTWPGGSGPQRWNDETTWSLAGNENPYLQGLAWCIGRRDNGVLSFGVGAPIEAIDVAAFVEGANVADANDWKVGGEVLSSDRKWDVLRTILQAGGGEPLRMGGRLSCMIRTPRVILANLTGREAVAEVSITGTKRRRDRLNQIIPNYRSEEHQWQIVPAGPVRVDAYVTADGGLRSREATYQLVQQPKQAAELAAYDLVDAREFEPMVFPVGPRWMGLKPGDCIAVNEPEFGLVAQPLIVQQREIDPATGQVTLTLRSETPGKHEYALGRVPNPPPVSGFQPIDPTFVSRPDAGSWVAWGGVLSGADGAQVPALVVTGAISDPNVSSVIIDYRLQLSPGMFGDWVTSSHPQTTRRMEFRAVISGGTYHVQVRYKSVRDVEGALALDLGLVTVGSLISSGVTQIGGQTPQELIDQLNETTALGLETSEKAADNAADILVTNQNLYDSTHLADGTPLEVYTVNSVNALNTADQYSIKRVDAMGILRGDNLSFQMSDTTLWASPTETWGQYRTSIQANFTATNAAITNEANVRAGQDTALAQSINNLSTTVGGNSASITNLQNSVNGLNAQWVLSVASTGPGYARVAGIKVAANPAVSSIVFAADQIGFTNGADNVYPLAVVGGKVYATNFQADDIKAHTIYTDKIVANNISVSARAATAGAVDLPYSPSGGGYDLLNVNFAASGGYIEIDVWGNASVSRDSEPETSGSVGFRLYVDGVAIEDFGVGMASSSAFNSVSYLFRHKPAPGVHNYRLNGWQTSSHAFATATRFYLTITDAKTEA
jgi:hypothetical protein